MRKTGGRKAVTKKGARSKAMAKAANAAAEPFRHVVVLMLENRSFDHVLGVLQAQIPSLEGIPWAGLRRSNPDPSGQAVEQRPGAGRIVDPDPKHEHSDVNEQMKNEMGKFVKDYAKSYPKTKAPQWQEVMAYHDTDTLPAIHALARSFAVCDHWFSSVPGPTWTNRLFAMSGTSQGRVDMPAGVFHPNLHRYDQPSLFRRLEEAGRSCRIYFGDFPLALLLEDRRSAKGAKSFARFSRFATDAAGPEADFPDFTWIEPDYMGADANDDHPPHDVTAGQALVAEVYEAIRGNPALFESTLLVVTYDEHGGFYDHVQPPPAIPPDAHNEEYDFDQCGVRVPMLYISPWLSPQVVKTSMDHTSLLRSLQLRWALGSLGKRVAAALDVFPLLSRTPAVRNDVPRLTAPKPKALPKAVHKQMKAKVEEHLSGNEQAIVAFSTWLDAQTPAPPATKAKAMTKVARGPQGSREVAAQRALDFLRAKRAKP